MRVAARLLLHAAPLGIARRDIHAPAIQSQVSFTYSASA